MRKKSPTLISALLLCVLVSCSTYIPLSVRKPPQLDMPPIRRIAVLDFDFTGSWSMWYDQNNTQITFQDIAKKVLVRELGLDQTTRPDPATAFPGDKVSSKLISHLVTNGHYEVLERAQLSRIVAEHNLNMSGMIDESKATKIGKMLGVEAIVIGSGDYAVSDNGKWTEYKKKEKILDSEGKPTGKTREVTVRKFKATRKVTSSLTYRVVDITTGRIVASRTHNRSGRLTSSEDTPRAAFSGLPDWQPALEGQTNAMCAGVVRQIAPYSVYQRRKIESGKHPLMKSARQYAKRGMLDDAKNAWDQVLTDPSTSGHKDRISARYNLAIYHEVNGDFDRAEQLLDDCFKKTGKNMYLDARVRVQARRKEVERLKDFDE